MPTEDFYKTSYIFKNKDPVRESLNDIRPLECLKKTFSSELFRQFKSKNEEKAELKNKNSLEAKENLNKHLEFYKNDDLNKKKNREMINNSIIFTNLRMKNEKKLNEKVSLIGFIINFSNILMFLFEMDL